MAVMGAGSFKGAAPVHRAAGASAEVVHRPHPPGVRQWRRPWALILPPLQGEGGRAQRDRVGMSDTPSMPLGACPLTSPPRPLCGLGLPVKGRAGAEK